MKASTAADDVERLQLATYPDARVHEHEEGVVLYTSRPPVAKLV